MVEKRSYLEPSKKLPILASTEVAVVGAGPAGLGASIAAARNGVKTFLIERYGFLGGNVTAGLMTCLNGWRQQRPPNDLQAVKGIGAKLIGRLYSMGAATADTHYEQEPFDISKGLLPFSVAVDPEALKYMALKMCQEAGVEFLLHSFVAGAIVEDDEIKGVVVENKSGRGVVEAQVVIDCSGDGDVAARANVPFDMAPNEDPRKMAWTLMYRTAGINRERLEGKLTDTIGGLTTLWGARTEKALDGTDVWDLTKGEVELRLRTWEAFQEMRKSKFGYENAYIAETATQVGVRETRRIRGEYVLTLDDALEAKPMPDCITICAKPIVNWFGYRFHFKHEGFEIPYRSLVPLKVDNLLLAGRCISQEQPVFQSSRSFAPSIAMGQASGTAAALAVHNGVAPRNLAVSLLQQTLLSQGAELGRRFHR